MTVPGKRRFLTRIGIVVLAFAAWFWIAYSFTSNHIVIAAVQYGLYIVGLLLIAVGWHWRILFVFATASVIGMVYELLGTRTGFPFGAYEYSYGMLPHFLGVPWFIVFMWGLLAVTVFLAVYPAMKRLGATLLAAPLLMVALDLSIDPIMVSMGLWQWINGGPWYGVPLSNFLGWFWVSVNIFLAVRLLVHNYIDKDMSIWERVFALPYLSHLISYALAAPLAALLASLILGVGTLVFLLRGLNL